MKFGLLVIGPAGSGKSTFCHVFQQHMAVLRRRCVVVNLDPAASSSSFLYTPEVDIREMVNVEEVEEELSLGPNGALVYAMHILEEQLDWLEAAVFRCCQEDDLLLFDCPGQIELYTHLPIMKNICMRMQQQWGLRLAACCCVDISFLNDAAKFIGGALMALSAMIQLELPHINLLTKCDLVHSHQLQIQTRSSHSSSSPPLSSPSASSAPSCTSSDISSSSSGEGRSEKEHEQEEEEEEESSCSKRHRRRKEAGRREEGRSGRGKSSRRKTERRRGMYEEKEAETEKRRLTADGEEKKQKDKEEEEEGKKAEEEGRQQEEAEKKSLVVGSRRLRQAKKWLQVTQQPGDDQLQLLQQQPGDDEQQQEEEEQREKREMSPVFEEKDEEAVKEKHKETEAEAAENITQKRENGEKRKKQQQAEEDEETKKEKEATCCSGGSSRGVGFSSLHADSPFGLHAMRLPGTTKKTKATKQKEEEGKEMQRKRRTRKKREKKMKSRTGAGNVEMDCLEAPEDRAKENAVDALLSRDPHQLLQQLDECTPVGYRKLNAAFAALLEDYNMVSFLPCDLTEEDSLERISAAVEQTLQYGEDLEVREVDLYGKE